MRSAIKREEQNVVECYKGAVNTIDIYRVYVHEQMEFIDETVYI